MFVLSGTPTVRTPAGETDVQSGDVICFAVGPDGAHQIRNAAPEPARVLIVSERTEVAAAVYEDSDKVGIFGPDLGLLFRRSDARDYWDGESSDVHQVTMIQPGGPRRMLQRDREVDPPGGGHVAPVPETPAERFRQSSPLSPGRCSVTALGATPTSCAASATAWGPASRAAGRGGSTGRWTRGTSPPTSVRGRTRPFSTRRGGVGANPVIVVLVVLTLWLLGSAALLGFCRIAARGDRLS